MSAVTALAQPETARAAELNELYAAVDDFAAGRINREQFKAERLKFGIYAQRQDGYYMVRTKIPSGLIAREAFFTMAAAAKEYGDGKAHLTTRQDIQIYYVPLEGLAPLITSLYHAGIKTVGAGGNTVRNITTSHPSGAYGDELFDVGPLARALSDYLLESPLSKGLPRKIKITFSASPTDAAGAFVDDIGFVAVQPKDGGHRHGFRMLVGGGQGSAPRLGKTLEEFVPADKVHEAALAVLKVFNRNGQRTVRSRARLKYYLETVGFENFKGLYRQELAAQGALPPLKVALGSSPATLGETIEVNPLAGDVSSAQMEQIGLLLGDNNGVYTRISKAGGLIFYGVEPLKAQSFRSGLINAGLVPQVKNCGACLLSCRGSSSCNEGITNSQGLTKQIDGIVRKYSALDGFMNLSVAVSGCANSCARHHTADIGLQGAARKVDGKLAPHYQFYLGGIGSGPEPKFAAQAGRVLARRAPEALEVVLKLILAERNSGESVADVFKRLGAKSFEEILKPFASPDDTSQIYVDWDADEEFSLEGVKPGECAGAAQELIEGLFNQSALSLAEAKAALASGDLALVRRQTKSSAINGVRGLLAAYGLDPVTEQELLNEFNAKFASRGALADGVFAELLSEPGEGEAIAAQRLTAAESFHQNVLAVYGSLNGGAIPAVETKKVDVLDLTGVKCPYNFVKVKLALEGLAVGAQMDVILDEGAPIKNVPESLKNEGHLVLSITPYEGGRFLLRLKKS
ncbi:MAG: sulfurtransferase TusA family protein [Nitrospinae bacterium]|nr:sulfurtransferase TusA family protein [Nitrospinota bacterium]